MIEVVHIVARVTTDMTRFNAGMASMEARAKTATAKMSLLGMRMTKYLTLPIAGIAYAGVKTATSFQKSMTLIQTQAGAAARDIPRVTKAIKEMAGNDVIQGPEDLADAYYHLQSVFGETVNVAGKLQMLKGIAHLAQVGGSNMEDTASAVAGILRTHLKGAHGVEQVIRTINGIVGSGNMRMPQFVESTGTAVLQVARLLGMSLKQVGAAEAVFTDENMNANMSMTRLRTSLMMAVNPSDAARKKMEQLGISSLRIGETMRSKNGFGNTLDYLSASYDRFVKKLEDKGMSRSAALTKAGGLLFGSFGGSKGASVWATLVQQHAMYHQKEEQITKKEQDFNRDLAASNKTLSAQFEKAWARMQVALIDFGNAVAPVVLGMTKGIVKLANAFTNLPEPVQRFVAAIGVGLAVLGPMLIMISSVVRSLQLIGGLLGEGGLVAAGFGGVLPLAIIAAVGALVFFMVKSKTFRDWVKHLVHEVGGFFNWLGKDVIGPFFFKVYKWFTEGGAASRWSTQVIPVLKAVGQTFKTVAHWVERLMYYLGKLFTSYLPRFGNWLGTHAADLFHAGDGPVMTDRQKLLTRLDQEHGTAQYKKDLAEASRKGYLKPHRRRHPGRAWGGPVMGGAAYTVGENGPETFVPGQNGTIVPNGGGRSPLVHIAEMHVRHESDAEIVSGKIARRLAIP